MKVGFVGLGRMGQGMAARLLGAGHDLLVHDPFPAQAASLVEAGAVAVDSPGATTLDRDVVISMLPSDDALSAVLDGQQGLLAAMPKTCIHMAMGTHGVPAIVAAARAHESAGQTFIACPVLGRPDLAAEGMLRLLPGGAAKAVAKVSPLFDILGQQTFPVGDKPQAAAAVKIANNFVLGCAIEAMGEAFSLVEKTGVQPALFLDVLLQGLFSAPAYQIYGAMIAGGSWESHGATALIGLKDADLAVEAAAAAGMQLPSLNVWRQHLLQAIEHGEAKLDWAVMAREHARQSGLDK